MKKLVVTILSAIMAVCLMGCGGRPAHMDETTYKLGCKALETMDAYNNMEISKEEAYKTLDEIDSKLNDRTFSEEEDSEEIRNGLVEAYVLGYKISMTSGSGLYEEADKLREALNK